MVTSDISVRLLRGIGRHLHGEGWEVHVASSAGPNLQRLANDEPVSTHALPMEREISLLKDFRSLVLTIRMVRRVKPDIISAGTPKAGLLGMLAARLTPGVRGVYLLRGLRLETAKGLHFLLLYLFEWLACRAADVIIPISPSLARRTASLRLARPRKLVTLGPGSSNGVDTARFLSTPETRSRQGQVDGQYSTPVLGFVGRIHEDKGISILAGALNRLRSRGICGTLLVAGPDDSPRASHLRGLLDRTGWAVHHLGLVDDLENLYPVLDVLCLPTRREGFANVVIEAACAGVPTIASDATGVVDAVVHNVTGIVTTPTTSETLADAIERVVGDDRLRTTLGDNARQRALRDFDHAVVWRRYHEFYARLLKSSVSV